tara:strand:+ start:369 stop:554 length:186 start_codon:yes stop_codon:yes gene_type:complete
MRCIACDKSLNDFESTRKSAETNDYIDLCNSCYREVQQEILVDEREDLRDGTEELYDEDQD